MSDRLFALRLFSRVARTGSFSSAGRELRLSQPSVSRIIATLEEEIGAALLTRTTRAVTLTEAGTDYLARIEPLLAGLEEADHAARGTGELRGVLRVGMAASFAVREVIPRLPGFMEQHPALRIDLSMADMRQDLVVEGVDVALRFGALTDSSATAKKLGVSTRLLVASPAYLERAGTPQKPTDLPDHSLIIGPIGSSQAGWSFHKDGKSTSIHVDGRLTLNVNEAATAAAVAGLGIASTGTWGCRHELADGRLIQVLADWAMSPVEVHAVFAAGRAAKPSARAFTDYLAAGLRRDMGE
jgi:DNA-binding transcriptional LysR family regulator